MPRIRSLVNLLGWRSRHSQELSAFGPAGLAGLAPRLFLLTSRRDLTRSRVLGIRGDSTGLAVALGLAALLWSRMSENGRARFGMNRVPAVGMIAARIDGQTKLVALVGYHSASVFM